MKFVTGLAVSGVLGLSMLAACGGDDDSAGSGGSSGSGGQGASGGTSGGAGQGATGGTSGTAGKAGGGGTGGTSDAGGSDGGGLVDCDGTCDKAAAASCPNDGTKQECVNTCGQLNAATSCTTEIQAYFACVDASGAATCDAAGQAAWPQCKSQLDALVACVTA